MWMLYVCDAWIMDVLFESELASPCMGTHACMHGRKRGRERERGGEGGRESPQFDRVGI